MNLKFIISAIIILVIFSCKKTPEIPRGNKVAFGATYTDSIGYFSAEVSSAITDLGGDIIINHGHCWSTTKEPTILDKITEYGKLIEPIVFTSELYELEDNTTYYLRIYISTNSSTIYSNDIKFNTLKTGLPNSTINEITNITLHTVQCEGEVLADSGLFVFKRGFCWDTDSVFNIDNCIDTINRGNNLGVFNGTVSELNEGLKYYVKTFAINEKGVGYGNPIEFLTVPITIPIVTTNEVSNISSSGALTGGNVISNGNGTITARGVCWSTNDNPTIVNNLGFTTGGVGIGSFFSSITDLVENTTYYVKAYSTNEKGTAYGEVKEFSTLSIELPTVTTNEVTIITAVSAICGGNVTNDGNSNVIAKGVCWNTIGDPTLVNCISKTVDGDGLGNYSSTITGLIDGTIYYVSSYATNENGTGYGVIKQFTTIPIIEPTVTTTEISDITATSATSGGNVTNDGSGTVSERGVCWNTIGNPTLQNNIGFTNDGGGLGSYISNLTGLTDNNTYHVAAYAKNEEGISYGQTITFVATNDFIDPRDGQTYETIVIGNQTWFAENLDYETTNSSWYENSSSNGTIYGRLYTWNAALSACPAGWHLPSDIEWTTLIDYLGGEEVAGGKMKEAGTTHWVSPNTGATNSSGFTARPGGYSGSTGVFNGIGSTGFWWSVTTYSSDRAWTRNLNYNYESVGRGWGQMEAKFSVRCIKD